MYTKYSWNQYCNFRWLPTQIFVLTSALHTCAAYQWHKLSSSYCNIESPNLIFLIILRLCNVVFFLLGGDSRCVQPTGSATWTAQIIDPWLVQTWWKSNYRLKVPVILVFQHAFGCSFLPGLVMDFIDIFYWSDWDLWILFANLGLRPFLKWPLLLPSNCSGMFPFNFCYLIWTREGIQS